MHGSIDVERCMEVQRRMRRELEWWYLKEYWKADKQDRDLVLALYGEILREELGKYRRVMFGS